MVEEMKIILMCVLDWVVYIVIVDVCIVVGLF